MRFRQIHLDFHTSPLIEGIGSAFDPKAFAGAFRDASVDSVTVFSKCHHGHSYHPTEIGRMHPGLGFDLLRGQIDALHGVGIKAPVYLSAAWDEYAADTHPEWRLVSPPGETMVRSRDNNPTGWAFLDFSSPYLDYLGRQVEEVMTHYGDADGIFIDICFQMQSVSIHARRAMEKAGLDWENESDRERFVRDSVRNFYESVTAAVRRHDAKMPLFFNSGHVVRGPAARHQAYNTHLELESLPTAGWGYDHFPVSARYVDPLGIPFIGMTGKFHFTWGEIGGYKRPEALTYECGAMLAHGAGCSIGDHLHPTGRIDPATMSIISPAYQWVAEREPWARGSQNKAQVGLLSLEAVESAQASGAPSRHSNVDDGAVRVLLEAGYSFDVLDTESDFDRYRLLILPDAVPVGAALQQKIEAYVAKGGRVLLTGRSGIDAETGFVFDLGAEWQGTSPMAGGDYARPIAALQADGIGEPVFMYVPSERIRVSDGESLGDVHEPYFDRTPKHFSGHIHSPVRPEASGYASGVRKGNYVYCSHPIFSAYHQVGAVRMLEMAEKLIGFALGQARLVETSLPRAGRVTVRHQAEAQRDIVHLLFATPAMRGNLWDANIQPIQDLIELKDVTVRLQVPSAPKSVTLVPSGATLDFTARDGGVDFVVPSLVGHQMVAVNY